MLNDTKRLPRIEIINISFAFTGAQYAALAHREQRRRRC